jgi:hypothetical protein
MFASGRGSCFKSYGYISDIENGNNAILMHAKKGKVAGFSGDISRDPPFFLQSNGAVYSCPMAIHVT